MSTIFHIIKDEQERLLEALSAYTAAINKEVQGAPQVKHLGNKDYLYIAQRNGDAVKYRYIGPVESTAALKVVASVKKRREYEELLKAVKNDLKEIRKALRGRKV